MREKARSLTPRQRKFIKGLVEGKSATQAVIDAGYSKKCSRAIASEILTKPYIQEAIGKLMEKSEIDDFTLAIMHRELIAGRELGPDGKPKDPNAKIDFAARARGLDMIFRLRGEYAQESQANKGVVIRVQSNVKDERSVET